MTAPPRVRLNRHAMPAHLEQRTPASAAAGGPPLRLLPVEPRTLKRVLVLIAGLTVLAIGVALLVLPGPAVLVIPAGLAILAVEFAWARRWLRRAKALVKVNRAPDPRGPHGVRGVPGRRPLAVLKRWWRHKRRARTATPPAPARGPEPPICGPEEGLPRL